MARPPTPNSVRITEGMRGHRPLRPEARHARGSPDRPKGLSKRATRVWDRLIEDMDPAMLRRADRDALAVLCEDEAMLAEAYQNLHKVGDTLTLFTSPEGRHALISIRDLANRLIVQRREFGLTPSSRVRVGASGKDPGDDSIDNAVFSGPSELLLLRKSS